MNLVQVALMGVVPSAVAALDAQRGSAEVAECGLGFLWNLSAPSENKVTRPRCGTEGGEVCLGAVVVCVHWHGFLG